MRVAGHLLHNVQQHRFRIIRGPAIVADHAVVPVIAAYEIIEVERILRVRGQHHARSRGLLHEERFAIPSPADLDALATAHEVVQARIQREQHTRTSIFIRAQHHQVTVLSGPHVNARTITLLVLRIRAEPHLHGRFASGWLIGWSAAGLRQQQRQDQRDHRQ